MIKIRYACLPEGLHATAVARGRHAIIYLRPGLRPGQRREALARLRRNARLGYAPPLPAAGLACALTADRIRRTLRDLLGTVHCHPLGALGVAGVLAGVAVSYMTLMTVPLPAASLPAGEDGPAGAGQLGTAGVAASALVPLGMKPRPWTVPETRPPHQRAGQPWYTRQPGPHPPARRAPHSRGGWWWPRQPAGQHEWPSRPRRGGHGWPRWHWPGGHGRPSRHWPGGHGRPSRHRPGGHGWPRWHWPGGHGRPSRHWRGRARARQRHRPAGRPQSAGRQESGLRADTQSGQPGPWPQPPAPGWPAADGGSPA